MVLVDPAKGKPEMVYLGVDATAADAAFEKAAADETNVAVRLFVYPHANRMRQPADEAAMAQKNADDAETEAKRTADAAVKQAKQNLDKAAAALEKAKDAHEAALGQTEAPEGEAEAPKGEVAGKPEKGSKKAKE